MFKYVDTGTVVTDKQVSSVTVEDLTVEVEANIAMPNATVRFNTGDEISDVPVNWSSSDIAAAKEKGVGTYVIHGTIAAEAVGEDSDVSAKGYLTITSRNIFSDGDIVKDSDEKWTLAGALKVKSENARTGSYSIGFWNDPASAPEKIEGSATITTNLPAGIYRIGGYLQGADADVVDDVTQEVVEGGKAQFRFSVQVGEDTPTVVETVVNGYKNWSNPEVDAVVVPEGGAEVTITVSIANVADKGWGGWDDFYIYRVHTVKFMSGGQLVSTQQVVDGTGAKTPVCNLSGYSIVSWSGSLDKILEDKVIEVQLASSATSSGGGSSSTTPTSGPTTEVTVDTLDDGTEVRTETTTDTDGSKVEVVTETAPDGSKTETKTETASDGEVVRVTVTETAVDGSSVEKVSETATNSAGNDVELTTTTRRDSEGAVVSVTEKSAFAESATATKTTVTVNKDGEGEIVSAEAVIVATLADSTQKISGEMFLTGWILSKGALLKTAAAGNKATLYGSVVKQILEAARTENVQITMLVKDSKGTTKYKVKADSGNLQIGQKLYLYKQNTKTGKYTMVDAKTYIVNKSGNVSVTISKNATYELVTSAKAAKINKEIKATIAPKKASVTLKKGKTTAFALSGKVNTDNIKSISYSTTKKAVATVGKTGKITAKKKGTATIKAKVTLTNGETKTIKMKVTVK